MAAANCEDKILSECEDRMLHNIKDADFKRKYWLLYGKVFSRQLIN
jgi:hypothetical protein